MCLCVYVCICIYVYIHVCLYVCIQCMCIDRYRYRYDSGATATYFLPEVDNWGIRLQNLFRIFCYSHLTSGNCGLPLLKNGTHGHNAILQIFFRRYKYFEVHLWKLMKNDLNKNQMPDVSPFKDSTNICPQFFFILCKYWVVIQ